MSAIPEAFLETTARLSDEVTRPFPASRKCYVTGSRPDLRVPMREVEQTPTLTSDGREENPPIYVYDTSGPYSDPAARIDLMAGLPEVRSAWIEERGDTELLDGPSSGFGRRRQQDPALASLRFEHIRRPRRARLKLRYSGVPGATSQDYTMGRFRHRVELNRAFLMDLNTHAEAEDHVVEYTKWISVGMLRRSNALKFIAGDDGAREGRPDRDEFELRSAILEFDW